MGLFEGSWSEKKDHWKKLPAPNNPLLFSTYTPSPKETGRVAAPPESILILEELEEGM